MKKISRVKVRRDFLRAAASGLVFRSNCVVVQCVANGLPYPRSGFTATKKIGNAVVRNRCKRRMRAASAEILAEVGRDGFDYIFIARKSTFSADWAEVLGTIKKAVLFLNRKNRNNYN